MLSTKVTALLEFIKTWGRKGHNIMQDKITIGVYQRLVYQRLLKQIDWSNIYTQDLGTEMS